MRSHGEDECHHHQLLAALGATGLTLEELWLPYFALGGDVGKVEVEANLTALMPMSASQHDMLAHAINERFDEIAPPRAPYRSEVPRVPDSDELP